MRTYATSGVAPYPGAAGGARAGGGAFGQLETRSTGFAPARAGAGGRAYSADIDAVIETAEVGAFRMATDVLFRAGETADGFGVGGDNAEGP